ncbi:hypothetical protein BD410DRAFT_780681 [Rickenella mellea]|uniref:ABC transporter domain-containing protein n=1 Tax=Rickenella mellea TaxID=50990 RepID=A0A4R5XG76_9AGAM|nr:hypothetical protein BD410DRAFT_780681 [Rickenella mellea]
MSNRSSQLDLVEQDKVPELPSQHATHQHYAHDAPPTSFNPAGSRKRKGSTASRVDIDYFDPEGVHNLRRTITQLSAATSHGESRRNVSLPEGSDSSEVTIGDEKFDFEQILRTVLQKRDESAIKARHLGVMWQNLRVVGLGATATYQPTFGSLLNPFGIVDAIRNARHPALKDILSGFEGVLTPGEMLLVLGRPGSGCSTLLKTLANQREEYHGVEGDVFYDSFRPKDIAKHYRGDVTYCPEDDVHFPTLTVAQTLAFAAKTRAPQSRIGDTSREQYVEEVVEIITTLFGLRHAKNTPVGDASIRGVSGGEKKRVSIAEALVCRSLLGAWDNSTRGLDASTALEFVRALRIGTDLMRMTTIVSIYQAGESLYELFNKVCVIAEGKMVYYGPADRARQYFIDMGFEPHDRQTTADFLVSVTDPNGRVFREGYESRVPRTSLEMAEYFKHSAAGQENRDAMAAYRAEHVGKPEKALAYKESAIQEHSRHTSLKGPYTISIFMQTRAVMLRRVQIILGDMSAQIVQLASFIFQAIIIGTVFLKIPHNTNAYFSRGGVLFFALLFGALSAMAEIPALFAQRPIVDRHKKSAMYHPFIEGLALTLVDIPITFVTQIVFCTILYELVQLQQTASQFFIFFLFLLLMTITMKAFFRSLAAMSKTESTAQSIAGVMILALVIYTGYTIPQPSQIGALKWITYINPLRYGFESIVVNEFHTLDGDCGSLVPSGPGYENVALANQVCTTVGSVPGQLTVNGNTFVNLSYNYSYSHIWRNLGIVIAYAGLFIAILLFFTEINTSSKGNTAVTLFKRGSKRELVESEESSDEEKGKSNGGGHGHGRDLNDDISEAAKAIGKENAMSDVFTWRNLEYVVPIDGGKSHRKLLDNVSGYVAPGKLTALMGESGAGKTTLLNVLAQRVSTGVVRGDRLVNGHSLPADFQAQTGYCQQMDTHLPETTVREALLFSAKLRQPQSVPLAEKEAYVETCLKMCGLEAHADAIVGSLGVEHRKRTTIGVELAAKPKLLLFLDEPTSGLDSQSAYAIMMFLRNLADSGQAILCTIHQPSGELFQVFDRLLLLRKGGQTVYFGDLGAKTSTLISYFERNGAQRCAPNANPAEWMLDVIGAGATATSVIDWHDTWLKSNEAGQVQEQINAIHAEGNRRPAVQASLHSEFASPWFYQFSTLTRRAFSSYWRNPTYLFAKLVLNIAAGLFIGFTFFKSKDSIQGNQNKLFAIFMATILVVPLSGQLQAVFIDFRNVYEIRERPSRMYSWTALITSQILVELPWNMLGAVLFFFCWYWTVGFDSHRAGYTFLAYCVVLPCYYTTIAQAVAAMAPNAVIANLLFSTLFTFVVTFNGVLQPFRELNWWKWMYRVSPFTYLIEGLLGQAIGGKTVTCADKELVTLNPPSGQSCSSYMQNFISSRGGYLANPDATSSCQFCPYRTTDQFMGSSFNIEYSHRWRNIGILCGVTLFNIAAVYALTYLFRIHTGSYLGSLRRMLRPKKEQSLPK